jgi:hypothetical protein
MLFLNFCELKPNLVGYKWALIIRSHLNAAAQLTRQIEFEPSSLTSSDGCHESSTAAGAQLPLTLRELAL